MFDETDDEESTAGEARPATEKKGAKRGAKGAAKPKPQAPKCHCCKVEMSAYDVTRGDSHGNCDRCAGERAAIARTVVHALATENVDPEDVASRAVSYADHLVLELARRPIGGDP